MTNGKKNPNNNRALQGILFSRAFAFFSTFERLIPDHAKKKTFSICFQIVTKAHEISRCPLGPFICPIDDLNTDQEYSYVYFYYCHSNNSEKFS